MLYCLVDGRARTSTELAIVAGVTPSTASVHLQGLKTQRLVKMVIQGKHRYYALERADVAAALEALSVLAGASSTAVAPPTPHRLRDARTCYDHIAGTLGVLLYDRVVSLRVGVRAFAIRCGRRRDGVRAARVRGARDRSRCNARAAPPLRLCVFGLERATAASRRGAGRRRPGSGPSASMDRAGPR